MPDKASKDEYAVAKWIRNNVPSKKTKFDRNHIVEYFTGARAVDALLDNSPWSKNMFETRQQVVDFLDLMLRHKFFHRAKKVVITEEELYKIKGIKKKVKEPKEEKKSAEKEKEKSKDPEKEKDEKESKDEKKEGEDKPEEKKKKPKVNSEINIDPKLIIVNFKFIVFFKLIFIHIFESQKT